MTVTVDTNLFELQFISDAHW